MKNIRSNQISLWDKIKIQNNLIIWKWLVYFKNSTAMCLMIYLYKNSKWVKWLKSQKRFLKLKKEELTTNPSSFATKPFHPSILTLNSIILYHQMKRFYRGFHLSRYYHSSKMKKCFLKKTHLMKNITMWRIVMNNCQIK